MHSFDVYIVDIAQKLQNLKFFAIFWSNCTITVILQFFSAFCKKKILKMALMNWKWSQLSGKCVFGALWCSRAKLDRGGIRCPPQSWQALSDVSLIRVKQGQQGKTLWNTSFVHFSRLKCWFLCQVKLYYRESAQWFLCRSQDDLM